MKQGGVLINRISKISGEVFQRLLVQRGIQPPPSGQGRIVFALLQGDGISQGELARRTGLDKSGLSLTLKRMIAGGLVTREVCEEDRRVVYIRLTEKVRGFREVFLEVSATMNAVFYAGFSGQEIVDFENKLEKILRNLETNLS